MARTSTAPPRTTSPGTITKTALPVDNPFDRAMRGVPTGEVGGSSTFPSPNLTSGPTPDFMPDSLSPAGNQLNAAGVSPQVILGGGLPTSPRPPVNPGGGWPPAPPGPVGSPAPPGGSPPPSGTGGVGGSPWPTHGAQTWEPGGGGHGLMMMARAYLTGGTIPANVSTAISGLPPENQALITSLLNGTASLNRQDPATHDMVRQLPIEVRQFLMAVSRYRRHMPGGATTPGAAAGAGTPPPGGANPFADALLATPPLPGNVGPSFEPSNTNPSLLLNAPVI